MTEPLSWTVDDTVDRTVVSVRGDLALAGTRALRTALLKRLAEQPPALVVELSGMTVSEPTALSLFTALVRQAATWPGIPVLLCAPSPAVAAQLAGGGYGRMPVYGDLDAALLTVTGGKAAALMLSDDLLPILGATRHARDMATEACARWSLPHLIGPASLVAGELVANVVSHVGTMMSLRFAMRGRYLHLAVRDGSVQEPVAGPPGFGLTMVEATAAHWGWMPTKDGKVVWAVLATDPEQNTPAW